MTKFKRITTAALAAAMLLPMSSIGVSAADADTENTIYESEVLYQETFSNWDAEGWTNQQAPPGMVLANADLTGKSNVFMTNLKPYSDDDGNKSALMWRSGNSGYPHQWYYEERNGAFDVIPFNKVINDGKIYVSMDVFIPEYAWYNDENRYYNDGDLDGTDADNAKKANGSNAISIFNTSTVDYDVDYDGKKWTYKATGEDLTGFIAADSESDHSDPANYVSNHQSLLAQFSFQSSKSTANIMTGAFTRIDSNANKEGASANKWTDTSRGWHKFQFIVDCDTTVKNSDGMWEGNLVKVYIDGTAYNESASTAKLVSDNVSGYKGIGLYRRGWARPGVRYDNIYVSHYSGRESGPAPIVTVSDDNKQISAALSEYVKDKPSIGGFVIKNASTGKVLNGYTSTEREREYVFDFDQPLENGKYKIYHKSAVGAITEKTNTEGTTFFVNSGGEPIFDKVTAYDYKNQAEAISSDDMSSDGTRTMPVSAKVKKIKVTFSADMSAKSVEDKIYLKDSNGATIGAQYTAEGKDVYLALDEWLTPGEKYTLCVDKDGMISQGGGNIILDVKNENICVLFDEKFDAGRVRATMSGSIFKSNSGEQKNTMLLASYIKRTDDNGNEFLELLDAKWQKLDATGQGLFNGSIMMSVSDGADIVRGYIFNDETGRLMTDNYFEKIISE